MLTGKISSQKLYDDLSRIFNANPINDYAWILRRYGVNSNDIVAEFRTNPIMKNLSDAKRNELINYLRDIERTPN